MSKKGSSDRVAKTAKAGKRHGTVNYPSAPSPEKLAASEAGEQQFIAKEQLYTERMAIRWDDKKMRFVNKTITVPIDYKYDPTRGRLVKSPVFKEKRKAS